jgi:hypothetical protein
MAKTLADLKTIARRKSNMENSTFIASDELTNYINESYAELYDLLVSRFEDYFSKTATLVVPNGSSEVTLPVDVYKVRGVDFIRGPNDFETVRRWTFEDRNKIDSVARSLHGASDRLYRIMGQKMVIQPLQYGAGNYQLWYIPRFTPLASDADEILDVMDFDDYITVDAAIKMMAKEESDTQVLMLQKAQLKERVEEMAANRDTMPERITDVRNIYENNFIIPRW